MLKKYNSREGSILAPIVAGTIAGAGLALLMAPQTGTALLRDLKRFARQTKDQALDTVEAGKALYDEGRTAVSDAVEEGRKTFVEGKKKIADFTDIDEHPVAASILATGVIGAGVALLLTTKTGKRMRREVKYAAANTVDQLASTLDKSREVYEEGKEAVSDALEAVRKAYVEGKEKLRRAA